MLLSDVKKSLEGLSSISFRLPSGEQIPVHFHVTEIGEITRHFIDCGGVVRTEKIINFQLWEANDFDHRLGAKKLLDIISLSESKLGIQDAEVEVEYQMDTIGRFGLEFSNGEFHLLSMQTNCLAADKCGIPPEKLKTNLKDLTASKSSSCCTPGGKCC